MAATEHLKMMIMAGGTGGHVFPALAVADVLRLRGVHVEWLGTPRGIENTLVHDANIALHHVRVEGVRGRGVFGLVKAPFLIVLAIIQAFFIIKNIKPNVIIGFGGFASGPGGVAAKLLGIPLVIHEQNAVAGTTNRLLAKIATRVLVAFDGAFIDGTINATAVGNPVRKTIANIAEPVVRYSNRFQMGASTLAPLNLLILGGSLGAKAINQLMPEALSKLPSNRQPNVWHQSGKNHIEATVAGYMQYQIKAKVDAFVGDMAAAYAWADLVVCRAGALTVSEIMAAGVAALLIPLPSAIDDHQTHNAAVLTRANAGITIAQKNLSAEKLAALLLIELSNRQHLQTMAINARLIALPQAAETVADICVEIALG